MTKDKSKIIIITIILFILTMFVISLATRHKTNGQNTKIISPEITDVALTVTTTGFVQPQNRLEIKPSINGRIEKILVKEGQPVNTGDILAWMSSAERAALVDAARSQETGSLEYWEQVYKQTPIISPLDGEVIVQAVEPGQTVTTADTVLVLSDRLVISAQFDETDIGRVKVGQKAYITLDAYPDVKLEGAVDHIAYESEVVNNVTIYNVDILPNDVPEILRSGMSVTVEVVEKSRTGVLAIPSAAIHYNGKRQFVYVQNQYGKPIERDIGVGLNNEKTAEITSGLTVNDKVLTQNTAYLPKKKNTGSSPFMPSRRR